MLWGAKIWRTGINLPNLPNISPSNFMTSYTVLTFSVISYKNSNNAFLSSCGTFISLVLSPLCLERKGLGIYAYTSLVQNGMQK